MNFIIGDTAFDREGIVIDREDTALYRESIVWKREDTVLSIEKNNLIEKKRKTVKVKAVLRFFLWQNPFL